MTRKVRSVRQSAGGPGREPPSAMVLAERGLDRRLLRRAYDEDSKAAIERAKSMAWWAQIAEERPYCDARWWVFLVDAAKL